MDQVLNNYWITGILLLIRLVVINISWLLIRTSDLFLALSAITTTIPDSLAFGILILNLRILACFVFEIVFTTQIEDPSVEATTRLRLANGVLLLGEIALLVVTLLELDQVQSASFLVGVVDSGSMLTILVNFSGYPILWVSILCYVAGMLLYLLPWENSNQQPMERSAIFLFVRTLFFPI